MHRLSQADFAIFRHCRSRRKEYTMAEGQTCLPELHINYRVSDGLGGSIGKGHMQVTQPLASAEKQQEGCMDET